MAKGRTQTTTKVINNVKTNTSTVSVEQVVVNNTLVPDHKDTNPGVFSQA